MTSRTYLGTEEEWHAVHQPWELSYHSQNNIRWPNRELEWNEQWESIFGFANLHKTSFPMDEVLLDVGCGSKPVLDYFSSGKKHFIDPLLGDYLQIPAMKTYWTNHSASCLHSMSAEHPITTLFGVCDLVLCWNVLDHSFDPFQIVENIYHYAKSGSLILIGTDLHERPHLGHPGIRSRAMFTSVIESRFKVLKRAQRGDFLACRDVSYLLQKR
jgi:hypothetical protein